MFNYPIRRPVSCLERPQKALIKQSLMVRWWRTITAYFSRPIRSSVWFYRPILWGVKRYDRHLRRLSDEELDIAIYALRKQMHQQGLSFGRIIRSFALIREVSGRELGMWQFDSQILGGLAILHGTVAQMHTGEGKTLTATLPVATAALAGIPTHVVTVNDYLTQRDAELMTPVYQRLGLSVGVIIEGLQVGQRKAQYACDITYCTNNELAFDFLKDRIQLIGNNHALQRHAMRGIHSHRSQALNQLMLRGLHFAVVDEADGVFMDEASTPLIISGDAKPQPEQSKMYQQAYTIMLQLERERDYMVNEKSRTVELTSVGEESIARLSANLGALWRARVRRIELVKQALSAHYLFRRDREYLIDEDKVVIIDEHTGRRMPERSWQKGLHQSIEIKEGCELSDPRVTLASVSFQNFFRHYYYLSGMTGTAKEVKHEFWRVYGLPVVDVPTNKKSQRITLGESVVQDEQQKWQKVVERIYSVQGGSRRPILIGTQSLHSSETLSALLDQLKITHQVLNARQDKHEAEVIARAGQLGCITIATSMAGRGTDIKLPNEVEILGGLHVIITGVHDTSRVDRQLAGRCARQGDKGSVEYVLSLEEPIITPKIKRLLTMIYHLRLPWKLKNTLLLKGIKRCQREAERTQEAQRKQLLKQDEQQQELLSFSDHRM